MAKINLNGREPSDQKMRRREFGKNLYGIDFIVAILFSLILLYQKDTQMILSYYFSKSSHKTRLDDAIAGLNLPVHVRNYVHCSRPESEVTCAQIIHAWRIVKEWRDMQNVLNRTIDDTHVVHVVPLEGSANQMFHLITGGLLSIAFNRTMFQVRNLEGYHVPDDAVRFQPVTCNKSQLGLFYDKIWDKYKWEGLQKSKYHFTVTHTLHTRYLVYTGIGHFTTGHFGEHMIYFLGNYFIRINDNIFDHVMKFVGRIPKTTYLFGVHLRYQGGYPFFIGPLDKVYKVIVPFLNEQLKKRPTQIFLATDSRIILNNMTDFFKDSLITLRYLPGTKSGINDLAMLMNCNKMICSFRSTFSYLASALTLKRSYWYDRDRPFLLYFSNSQNGIISMLWESVKVYSKRTNEFDHLMPGNENLLRRYFHNQIY